MRTLCLFLVVFAGCGKVAAVPDASLDAQLPDALTCSGAQLVCSNACADPMTSVDHCGTCDNACAADHETCNSGHCVDFTASCATIHAAQPAAVSGPFTLLDQTTVFCDFDHNMTYTALAYGQYDVAHAGFTMISVDDLQSDVLQKAFIFLYNKQGGMTLIAQWTDANCCFKADTLVNNANMMYLKGSNITPASATDASKCNVAHTDSPAHFLISATGTASGAQLADDFFVTNPATAGTGCSASSNPAFFWARKPST